MTSLFWILVFWATQSFASSFLRAVSTIRGRGSSSRPSISSDLNQKVCRGIGVIPSLFTNPNDLFFEATPGANSMGIASTLAVCRTRDMYLNPTPESCMAFQYQTVSNCLHFEKVGHGLQRVQHVYNNAPAIFGFRDDIEKQCGGDMCCQGNGINEAPEYIRLALDPWDLCANLFFTLCAAAGWLQGQARGARGGKLFFPAATRKVYQGIHVNPADRADTVGLTVHEMCTLDRICRNGANIWNLKRNSGFDCEFDMTLLLPPPPPPAPSMSESAPLLRSDGVVMGSIVPESEIRPHEIVRGSVVYPPATRSAFSSAPLSTEERGITAPVSGSVVRPYSPEIGRPAYRVDENGYPIMDIADSEVEVQKAQLKFENGGFSFEQFTLALFLVLNYFLIKVCVCKRELKTIPLLEEDV